MSQLTGMAWTVLLLWAMEPGTVTVVKPTENPALGVRHYLVQLRIIEVDEQGAQTLIAQPVLQTTGAAAGVTVTGDTGRRFEFHFSTADAGEPSSIPVVLADDPVTSRPAVPQAAMPAVGMLQQKITLKAVQQPRQLVLSHIADQAGLSLALDPTSVAATIAKLETPVTFEVDNAPIGDVLQKLVESIDLRYAVKNDLILISAERPASPKAVPQKIAEAPAREPSSNSKVSADWQVRVYAVSDLVKPDPETGKANLEALARELQAQVLPDSWSAKGGEGSIRGFESTVSLVIRQTEMGHEAIARALEQRRKGTAVAP